MPEHSTEKGENELWGRYWGGLSGRKGGGNNFFLRAVTAFAEVRLYGNLADDVAGKRGKKTNPIAVSSIVFASIFGAALAGMAVRRFLPEHHVGSDAKEVVRLATGLIATMAALVLGMLVSSAKSSYDARQTEVAEMSSEVVTIDRLLARYGAETGEIRAQFRQLVERGIERIWPKEASVRADLRPKDTGSTLVHQLDLLPAKNDAQSTAKAQLGPLIFSLQQTQWLMFLKSQQSSIPVPLLVVVVSWLAAIFVSFGLFAPPNSTVVVTLAVGALAVSAAIFIIMELYTPFRGVLRISPTPVLEALSQMGR